METASPLIYGKLADIMADVAPIAKDRKNPQQGYSFRGIDDFLNMVHPLLAKHRVIVAAKYSDMKREERQTARGGTMTVTVVTGAVQFLAEDGSSVTTETIGEGMDSGDKSANKAMSAAYKYALMQTFAVPVGLAVDSETESPEPTTPVQQPDTQARKFFNRGQQQQGEPAQQSAKPNALLLAKRALLQKATAWCGDNREEAIHSINEEAARMDADMQTIEGVRMVADSLRAQYEPEGAQA